MKLLFLFTLFMSTAVSADWTIAQQKVELAQCPNGSCVVSKSCLEKKQPTCMALEAAKNRQKSDVGPGGTNPGSAVCTKFHKAGVVIAMNDEGGTHAFCRFSDGSLLSLDGLWHW